MKLKTKLATILVAGLVLVGQASAMSLVPGDFYTTPGDFSNEISHYDQNGNFIDSYIVNSGYGQAVHGITFSPTGLLYAVMVPQNIHDGLNILAINNVGSVVQTYTATDFIAGSNATGKLNFGPDGRFYVAANNRVLSYTPGNPTATQVYTNSGFTDVKPLANGNLLVLSDYNLREITSSGVFVRDILTNPFLTNAQGIEYDAATNKIFVTMLGDSNNPFAVMRVDGTTGQLEVNQTFHYAADIQRTADGRYLVGSRTQIPRFYDSNLNVVGTLGSTQQYNVTQMPAAVPEPASMAVLGLGVLALVRRRKNR